jgi:protein-S-isoprenylcysteine O-methyltransferase Ste14
VKILNTALRYVDGFLFAAFAAVVIAQRDYGARFKIGMSIAAVGIILWAVARVQLGSSFAVTAQAKKLGATGLYSQIRNPIYAFGGLGYIGLFIAFGKWPALAVFLVLYSYQISRVKKEERVLEQAFGDEYRKYRTSTWFCRCSLDA